LSSFKPGLYDLALIDFRMPKMYGHELYDEMKKIDSKLKICFILYFPFLTRVCELFISTAE
jgi:CheY-like chemotaxis protein